MCYINDCVQLKLCKKTKLKSVGKHLNSNQLTRNSGIRCFQLELSHFFTGHSTTNLHIYW